MTASRAAVAEPDLIARREGAAGIIRLNRPKAINAVISVKIDATRAVLRAGAPAIIKIAATIGQKMMNRSISGKRRNK